MFQAFHMHLKIFNGSHSKKWALSGTSTQLTQLLTNNKETSAYVHCFSINVYKFIKEITHLICQTQYTLVYFYIYWKRYTAHPCSCRRFSWLLFLSGNRQIYLLLIYPLGLWQKKNFNEGHTGIFGTFCIFSHNLAILNLLVNTQWHMHAFKLWLEQTIKYA